MSLRQAFTSALHLFVVFAFFLAGLCFVSFPYLPELKVQIFEKCTHIGLGLLLSALLLVLSFYTLDRGRYLIIKMDVSTNMQVIRQTVEECFSRQFLKKISLLDIEVGRKSRLEIKVSLAKLDEKQREALFLEVEEHLGTLLRDRFGYSRPFYLVAK